MWSSFILNKYIEVEGRSSFPSIVDRQLEYGFGTECSWEMLLGAMCDFQCIEKTQDIEKSICWSHLVD